MYGMSGRISTRSDVLVVSRKGRVCVCGVCVGGGGVAPSSGSSLVVPKAVITLGKCKGNSPSNRFVGGAGSRCTMLWAL